jgi:major membrane immunogen (membrane-anchored lipoprotein)
MNKFTLTVVAAASLLMAACQTTGSSSEYSKLDASGMATLEQVKGTEAEARSKGYRPLNKAEIEAISENKKTLSLTRNGIPFTLKFRPADTKYSKPEWIVRMTVGKTWQDLIYDYNTKTGHIAVADSFKSMKEKNEMYLRPYVNDAGEYICANQHAYLVPCTVH